MLRTDEEIKICEQFGKAEFGREACEGCPLRIRHNEKMCRAIAHYNRAIGRWEFD